MGKPDENIRALEAMRSSGPNKVQASSLAEDIYEDLVAETSVTRLIDEIAGEQRSTHNVHLAKGLCHYYLAGLIQFLLDYLQNQGGVDTVESKDQLVRILRDRGDDLFAGGMGRYVHATIDEYFPTPAYEGLPHDLVVDEVIDISDTIIDTLS